METCLLRGTHLRLKSTVNPAITPFSSTGLPIGMLIIGFPSEPASPEKTWISRLVEIEHGIRLRDYLQRKDTSEQLKRETSCANTVYLSVLRVDRFRSKPGPRDRAWH